MWRGCGWRGGRPWPISRCWSGREATDSCGSRCTTAGCSVWSCATRQLSRRFAAPSRSRYAAGRRSSVRGPQWPATRNRARCGPAPAPEPTTRFSSIPPCGAGRWRTGCTLTGTRRAHGFVRDGALLSFGWGRFGVMPASGRGRGRRVRALAVRTPTPPASSGASQGRPVPLPRSMNVGGAVWVPH